MIEPIAIEIGKKLAGEIADGQAATAVKRSEQVVAGEQQMDRFLGVGGVDDAIGQRQGALTGDTSAQVAFEDFVVDGGKYR